MEDWTSDYESVRTLNLRNTVIHVLGVLGVGVWLHRRGCRRQPKRARHTRKNQVQHPQLQHHQVEKHPQESDGDQIQMDDTGFDRRSHPIGPRSIPTGNDHSLRQRGPDAWHCLRRECDQTRQRCLALAEELERTRLEREQLREQLSLSLARPGAPSRVSDSPRRGAPLLSSLPLSSKVGASVPVGCPTEILTETSESTTTATAPWLERTTPVHSDHSSPFHSDETETDVGLSKTAAQKLDKTSADGFRLDPREVAAAMALRQRGFGGGLLNEASVDEVRKRLGFAAQADMNRRPTEHDEQLRDVFSYYGD